MIRCLQQNAPIKRLFLKTEYEPTSRAWNINISPQTISGWKRKYGEMDVNEARKLKALEEENARMKRIIDNEIVSVAQGYPEAGLVRHERAIHRLRQCEKAWSPRSSPSA